MVASQDVVLARYEQSQSAASVQAYQEANHGEPVICDVQFSYNPVHKTPPGLPRSSSATESWKWVEKESRGRLLGQLDIWPTCPNQFDWLSCELPRSASPSAVTSRGVNNCTGVYALVAEDLGMLEKCFSYHSELTDAASSQQMFCSDVDPEHHVCTASMECMSQQSRSSILRTGLQQSVCG